MKERKADHTETTDQKETAETGKTPSGLKKPKTMATAVATEK